MSLVQRQDNTFRRDKNRDNEIRKLYELIYSGGIVLRGTGSPEGVVSADIGVMYQREDGGANTSLYVKESGSGSIGWVAK